MNAFLNFLRGNLVFFITKVIENNIDGKDIGQNLDKQMDKLLGENASEKVQRLVIANLMFEILEGLYLENPDDFIELLNKRAESIM